MINKNLYVLFENELWKRDNLWVKDDYVLRSLYSSKFFKIVNGKLKHGFTDTIVSDSLDLPTFYLTYEEVNNLLGKISPDCTNYIYSIDFDNTLGIDKDIDQLAIEYKLKRILCLDKKQSLINEDAKMSFFNIDSTFYASFFNLSYDDIKRYFDLIINDLKSEGFTSISYKKEFVDNIK